MPRITRLERLGLIALLGAGLYTFFFFADYWFATPQRGDKGWFLVLTFAVFWKPVRAIYGFWLYLWAETPETPAPRLTEVCVEGTFDVVTTAMPGEPFAMFERTLQAVAQMDGIHQAFLLDGGNDPILRALCAKNSVKHVNCKHISGAKAGKVNYCLQEFSRAKFVLVVDPDHVPEPDFASRVLPLFADSKVGFVQVVQAYYNLRENWVAWAAAEQTFGFYGPTLMGLHGLGLATAIGANCTFRRRALDTVGGHAEHLAEDALTSMRLHAAGWSSAYLPWRGSFGLVPTDLSAFWKQQLKWATGMTYLLIREYPKLFLRFSPMAKVHYLLASSYYLGGLAAALNFLLPIVFLFFQVYAVEMPLTGFLFHLAPYLLVAMLINWWVQRWYSHLEERGLPWRAMLLEHATWHIFLLGWMNAILGRKVPYLPTPKGEGSHVPFALIAPHWCVILLSWAAIAWVPLSYARIDAGTELMVAFAALNSLLLLPVALTGLRGKRAIWRLVSGQTGVKHGQESACDATLY